MQRHRYNRAEEAQANKGKHSRKPISRNIQHIRSDQLDDTSSSTQPKSASQNLRVNRSQRRPELVEVLQELGATATSVAPANRNPLPLQDAHHLLSSNAKRLGARDTFTLPLPAHTFPKADQIDLSQDTPCSRNKYRKKSELVDHEPTTMPSKSPGRKSRPLKSEPIDLTTSQEIPESDQEAQGLPQPDQVEVEDSIDTDGEDGKTLRARSTRKSRPSAKVREQKIRRESPTSETGKHLANGLTEERAAGHLPNPLVNVGVGTVLLHGSDTIQLVDPSSPDIPTSKPKQSTDLSGSIPTSVTNGNITVAVEVLETKSSIRARRSRKEKWIARGAQYNKGNLRTADAQNYSQQKPKSSMGKVSSYGAPKPTNRLNAIPINNRPFDLQKGVYRGGPGISSTPSQVELPAPKRQRIDSKKRGSNSSSSDVIDLEDDSNNRSWRERSSTRSLSLKSDGGVSRPLKKAASKTLAEYQSVESAVNPDRKQAFAKRHRVSDDDVKNISQPASAIPQPAKTRISPDVSLLEDSNDPISDPDANAVSKGNTATKAPGFYKPSLSKKAFKLPASNDHTSHEKDEYKDNQYRSYGGPQPKRSVSLSSDELPDSSTVVQRNAKRQRTSRASDGSMDELQSKFFSPTKQPDHQLKKKAGILLKAIKGKATAPTVETSDTDDEADNKSASIQPSNLSAIKISRPGTATESGHFIVKQVFPIRGGALIGYSKNQWTLEHDIGSKDQKKGRLIFKDSEDKTVVVIHTSSIQKIDWDESAKMIIFRSATENSLCGGRIYLELEDTAASSTFRNRLKKADNTIILVKNTASLENGLSYFDRAFKRPQNHRLEPKKKTPSINDAEDLQLLQSKSEARSDQRWLEKRGAQAGGQARPTGSEQQVGDASQPVKPKSLARSMQTDNTERKNQQIERTGIASPSQAFYGNGNRPLRSAALRENEPIRSSPRVAGRTIAPRPRERTPTPPLTWTELNPEWDKMWNGTVYYPPGERKGQVTVERDDILRLNEGEFLNDNLVTFYLRYLEHTLQENRPEVAKRIYFHNSYFYTTLTKSAKKGINYQAVQRWTKNVDIISKDYIIVPICENLHWYVAIICNASKLLVSEAPEKTELKTTYDNEEEAIQPSTTMQKHVGNTSVEVDGITGNGDTITLKYPSPSAIEPEDCKEPKTVDSTAQASSDANKLCPEGQEARLEVENSSAQTQKEHSEETTSRPEADSDVQNALDGEASAPKPSIDNVVASLEEHPIASIKSDLNGLPTKKSARKAKKGTRAPIRDPTKPRIITLDSLAVTHSVTCTNLKEYLVAEIKDKRGADIVPPKEIGMPARNIPTQDNHCDCGLYLLAYVTKFLESPDDFVLGIYQKREEIGWDPKAPKIRNDVRELLFKLQDTITPQKPAKNRPKQIKTDKPTTSSAGLSAPLPPGTSRLVNAAGPRVGAAEIQGVESLAMTENGMIKQQSTTATPLFDSSVHEKEHANASLQLSSKNGMEDVLSKTTTIILGNEDVQPGRIEVGKSESFPLEIGDSPESKRFRDDSQQQHRMVARNQKTDLLNSQPSSSQPSADSSATFTKQCSAESDKTRSVSMYPDPPSSTGLIDPIDPFIEAPRPSDFLGSEPSTPVNINNSTPQFEKYADRSYEGPRSSTSIHKFDAEDDFDMTGSRIQEPSAFRNIAPGSDDDGVDYAELTQRCRDYHQSSRAIKPEVLVSDENDTMLLDVTEEHEKREINGFFEEDKEYEEADELHNKSIDRSRVNGSFTPDQINKGTKTTFSE